MSKIELFLKKSPLYSALVLESFFSSKKRRVLINLTKYCLLAIPVIIIVSLILNRYDLHIFGNITDFLSQKLFGLTLIFLAIYGLMQIFEAYFASIYYFEYIAKNNYSSNEHYTFSAGRILRRVENDNLLIGLLKSQSIGKNIVTRLGITSAEANQLLIKQAEVKNPAIFNTNDTALVKVSTIVNFIYENNIDFKNLLTSHGLGPKDLEAVVNLIVYDIEAKEEQRRWWTRDKLARIPGLASDWSFGRTYLLNKYSRNLLNDEEVNSEAIILSGRNRELEQIQTILNRSNGANIFLIGLPGQEKMEVVWNLSRKIKNQTVGSKLINKKPILFLTNDFTLTIKDKKDFEIKLIKIISEAMSSGNIILVIDNFPKLLLQAKQFDLNLLEIIEPFLGSYNDQIIALADTEYFHTLIEPDQAIMSHFETVLIKPLLLEEITKIIGREALIMEKIYGLTYTYPAILEIAKGAEYYFPDGVSSDKARDLLSELSPWARENNYDIIDKDQALEYISKKTNIPLGSIQRTEKEKLLNLENLLMKRVIAQREAVFAVCNSLRRNRAGIRNENRPIGSFLFLGPTGVGKTETAKALAEIYFGDEKLLLRLDMTEYQNPDALSRLIGSSNNEKAGILAKMLREHPYGVLLLDEFEKTNPEVLNLFLQIIDEGYFSDADGKKVMARNIMFIATTNAGADKIFEIIEKNKNLKDYETEIISYIIKENYFKPELLNRFDANIFFHPLSKENLEGIAKLMLEKVAKKLAQKGIIFSYDKKLIDFTVAGGYNPSFGARPMNRFIQDTIEQELANLLIREEISAGQTINFEIINSENKQNLKPIIS